MEVTMGVDREVSQPPIERLVTAATDLFYRLGFQAVSIDDITQASGVTRPTLYRHFHSKDQLGAICLQRLVEAERASWDRIAAQTQGEAQAELRALIAHYADRLAAPDFRGSPFANTALELTEPDHPARRVAEHFEAEMRVHLGALCVRADCIRPDALADGLFLLMHGAAASRHFSAAHGPALALSHVAETLLAAHLPAAQRL
jgi:AcrR family transcriptional regulator